MIEAKISGFGCEGCARSFESLSQRPELNKMIETELQRIAKQKEAEAVALEVIN